MIKLAEGPDRGVTSTDPSDREGEWRNLQSLFCDAAIERKPTKDRPNLTAFKNS
jgi:hypothetical protein